MLAKRNVCVKDTGGWPEAVEMYSATMLTQPSVSWWFPSVGLTLILLLTPSLRVFCYVSDFYWLTLQNLLYDSYMIFLK